MAFYFLTERLGLCCGGGGVGFFGWLLFLLRDIALFGFVGLLFVDVVIIGREVVIGQSLIGSIVHVVVVAIADNNGLLSARVIGVYVLEGIFV